ncbi:hypothetical protein XarbCFBP7629_19690 [Xanthomonas arboricola]|nr:hypothetical protein XarbCFBP7629_19690 [Xanthomonas arboricola]
MRRVLRGWTDKGPAAKRQISRSAADASASPNPLEHNTKSKLVKSCLSRVCRTSSIGQRA